MKELILLICCNESGSKLNKVDKGSIDFIGEFYLLLVNS